MRPQQNEIGRREFLQTSAAGLAGLILSGRFTLNAQNRTDTIALNAWIQIGTDDTVTLIASQAEMGQGAGTTLPALLAEELGADWKRVRLEQAPVDTAYRNPRINWQFTGNSESTTGFFDLLRRMGASARVMLVEAAAEQWNVPLEECVTENSVVLHLPSRRTLRFGELADRAARKAPPKDPELKQPAEWKLLGRSLGRVDIPAKLNGSAVFGMDFRIPGMVYAAIALAPTFGGKVKKHDRTLAISMPGVIDVVEIPDGVAVVADSYWRARKALAATPIEWDEGPNASVNTASLMSQYRAAVDGDQWMRVKVSGFPPAGGETVTADYESQFMAHATMEPMNCTARVTKDQCEIWGPIQGQELTRFEVAQALQMPPERVQVNRTFLGGGFGRRLWTDFSRQAALVSRAVGRPVQVIWSRETDMQHDIYRPAVLNRITARVD